MNTDKSKARQIFDKKQVFGYEPEVELDSEDYY